MSLIEPRTRSEKPNKKHRKDMLIINGVVLQTYQYFMVAKEKVMTKENKMPYEIWADPISLPDAYIRRYHMVKMDDGCEQYIHKEQDRAQLIEKLEGMKKAYHIDIRYSGYDSIKVDNTSTIDEVIKLLEEKP